VSPNELLRHALGCSEIPGRIERQCWYACTAIRIESIIIVNAADGEESPTRWVSGSRDVAYVGGFEEVELVLRSGCDAAREDGEELEENATSEKYERGEGEKRSWGEG
jgi:hypothetical protein